MVFSRDLIFFAVRWKVKIELRDNFSRRTTHRIEYKGYKVIFTLSIRKNEK